MKTMYTSFNQMHHPHKFPMQSPTPHSNYGTTDSAILHLLLFFMPSSQTTFPTPVLFNKCLDCLSNKSHKLPFSRSSISSSSPLEILYSYLWGPAPGNSIDGFRYYVIFVDHFSKYVWLYPLKLKYDVPTIFPIFKNLVERQFNSRIKTLYSDNGGEFIKIRPFLQANGISH